MDHSEHVQAYLNQHGIHGKDVSIVAAVSGGADSIALLDILSNLEFTVLVAHYNHQLRVDSSEDAAFVESLAARYGWEFVTESAPAGALMHPGTSIEESARDHRYRFLWKTAVEHGIHLVAAGHTADDQVETILMHLLRGAGPAGLRGMLPISSMDQWSGYFAVEGRSIRLLRPLLCLNRSQTLEQCKIKGIRPREDSSNQDQTFFRNRLRHELLPLLESYNSGVRSHLLQLSSLMSEQHDWVTTAAMAHFDDL